jgi:transcription antitermination factor NusG
VPADPPAQPGPSPTAAPPDPSLRDASTHLPPEPEPPFFAASADALDAADWHVLHVKSRQEKVVHDALTAQGVASYLPLMPTVRFYGKQKVTRELPLFPGYVFMRGPRDCAFSVDRNGRLVQILPVIDPDHLIAELRSINLALSSGADPAPADYLAVGDRVRVRSGPFKDVVGVIERRDRPGRLHLQIDMLHRAITIEIDTTLLDRLD